VRVAVAAILLAFFGSSALALVKDGRGLTPASASTPASNSTAAAPASIANTSSMTASSSTASASPIATKLAEPLSIAPVTPELAPANTFLSGNAFLTNNGLATNGLAPIHALLTPPAALIKLKTPPGIHSFFDARNTFGLASLGVSLTADALSTQKGLAYPGFTEMNPIARPFVQTRLGAAAYNAGSFGLLAGLMYWAHKTEHHKLERILPFAVGGWEGLLSARNYRVIANRAR
jgi:hypothetical protein